jgi:tetratricopeptide (TPR) repeat protein
VDLIEEAIAVYEEVLGLRPPHDQQRAQAVNDLAGVLEQFCVHHGEGRPWVRGQRCIGLLRESLELRPPGHSLRDQSLHSLGRAIGLVKHKETEDRVQRVMTCVDLNREALQLRPLGHPDREKSLTNLGLGLRDLFDFTRDQNVLEEAILIQRQVLEVCAPGHPLRHNALNNLAICLRTWFEHRGGIDRLAEAIRLLREALLLRPSGHPMRYMTLDNLSWAIGLSATIPDRAEQFQESISVEREALRILPEDHAQRARIQGNLAHCLMRAFRHGFTSSEVVSEAVALRREALEYATLRCLTVHSVMGGLADALAARFDLHKVEDDFLEALSLKRQSLKLCPARDWRRSEIMLELASLLCKPECALWSEALLLFREALELMPSGFPNRAPLLSDMSRCFLEPSSEFFDFTQGMALISEAHLDQFCPVYVRLKSAVFNLRQIEEAYSVITCCLRDIEGDDMEIQVLELYIEVINLLPRVANFGLDHNARLQAITGSDEIVRNAAARALHLGRIPHAVEMLEEGRGVFWSQTLRLRTTGFDGVPDKDRQDLERLLQMLDFSTRRDQSSEMSVTQREKDLEERRQLNEQAEALITTIRGYPGLARFLMPAAFADLVSALPDGYIVILNSSSLGHHALLLNGARGLATSFELQASYRDFDSETIRSQVDRNILREANSEPLWEGTRAMKVSGRRLKSLDDTLTLLWDSIVRPVLNELSIEVSLVHAIIA